MLLNHPQILVNTQLLTPLSEMLFKLPRPCCPDHVSSGLGPQQALWRCFQGTGICSEQLCWMLGVQRSKILKFCALALWSLPDGAADIHPTTHHKLVND